MSIPVVAEAGRTSTDAQVIAELAAGAMESIARIHAAGLAEVVDIAENPPVLPSQSAVIEAETDTEDEAVVEDETVIEAETETAAEAETGIEAEAETPVEDEDEVETVIEVRATDAEPATAEFATPAEGLRAVPASTRGRHFSEAETTEFAAQRAA